MNFSNFNRSINEIKLKSRRYEISRSSGKFSLHEREIDVDFYFRFVHHQASRWISRFSHRIDCANVDRRRFLSNHSDLIVVAFQFDIFPINSENKNHLESIQNIGAQCLRFPTNSKKISFDHVFIELSRIYPSEFITITNTITSSINRKSFAKIQISPIVKIF